MRIGTFASIPRPGATVPAPLSRALLLPTHGHWVLLLASLLAVLFIVDATDRSNAVRVWYWSHVVAPPLEVHYGFKVVPARSGHDLAVASVVAGGLFQQAGVRPGWLSASSSCFGASQYELLFAELSRGKEQRVPVRLPFVAGDPYETGSLRWVVIPPPCRLASSCRLTRRAADFVHERVLSRSSSRGRTAVENAQRFPRAVGSRPARTSIQWR